jgi:hypothetical protein
LGDASLYEDLLSKSFRRRISIRFFILIIVDGCGNGHSRQAQGRRDGSALPMLVQSDNLSLYFCFRMIFPRNWCPLSRNML